MMAEKVSVYGLYIVGDTRFELVTPCVSMRKYIFFLLAQFQSSMISRSFVFIKFMDSIKFYLEALKRHSRLNLAIQYLY